jgi:hypothetical protein
MNVKGQKDKSFIASTRERQKRWKRRQQCRQKKTSLWEETSANKRHNRRKRRRKKRQKRNDENEKILETVIKIFSSLFSKPGAKTIQLFTTVIKCV